MFATDMTKVNQEAAKEQARQGRRLYRPQEGYNRVRIAPPYKEGMGLPWFKTRVHYGCAIGDDDPVLPVCLKVFSQPCAICEWRFALKGQLQWEQLLKDRRPTDYVLANAVVRGQEQSLYQALKMGFTLFASLQEIMGKWGDITNIWQGRDVTFSYQKLGPARDMVRYGGFQPEAEVGPIGIPNPEQGMNDLETYVDYLTYDEQRYLLDGQWVRSELTAVPFNRRSAVPAQEVQQPPLQQMPVTQQLQQVPMDAQTMPPVQQPPPPMPQAQPMVTPYAETGQVHMQPPPQAAQQPITPPPMPQAPPPMAPPQQPPVAPGSWQQQAQALGTGMPAGQHPGSQMPGAPPAWAPPAPPAAPPMPQPPGTLGGRVAPQGPGQVPQAPPMPAPPGAAAIGQGGPGAAPFGGGPMPGPGISSPSPSHPSSAPPGPLPPQPPPMAPPPQAQPAAPPPAANPVQGGEAVNEDLVAAAMQAQAGLPQPPQG